MAIAERTRYLKSSSSSHPGLLPPKILPMSYIPIPVSYLYASLGASVVIAGLWGSSWPHWYFHLDAFLIAFSAFNSLCSIMIVHHIVTLLWSHHRGQCISPNQEHRAQCGRSAFALHIANITFFRVMLLLFGVAVILSVVRLILYAWWRGSLPLVACGAIETVVIYGILGKMKETQRLRGSYGKSTARWLLCGQRRPDTVPSLES